ncbi:hypothetical protein QYM36_003710 [Artemia franciscana]|uniref:Uncharacterized protein n=1 Tax=Artemia franciscana TaxID=6661 RepID=A0AA88LE81_ARTSF|nr:hypothetical protein QYM36_003710 [Artemia franciscana]
MEFETADILKNVKDGANEHDVNTPRKAEAITNIEYSEDVDEGRNNLHQFITKNGDLKDDTQNDIKGDATDPCKETVHMTKAQDLIEMGAKTPGKREPITNIQYSEDVDEESNNVCQSLTKDGDLKDDTQNDVKGSSSYIPSNTEFEEDTMANNFADRRRRSP